MIVLPLAGRRIECTIVALACVGPSADLIELIEALHILLWVSGAYLSTYTCICLTRR